VLQAYNIIKLKQMQHFNVGQVVRTDYGIISSMV